MIKVNNYDSFEDALSSIIKEEKEYIVLRHKLKQGEKVKVHYHKKANEWLVIKEGNFKVVLDGKEKEFSLENKVIAISLPKKSKHSLVPLSKLSYFVVRDCQDSTIYID